MPCGGHLERGGATPWLNGPHATPWLNGPVVCLVFVLSLLVPAWARANPDIKWRTLETEHFYIHYWAGNEEVAERGARLAEKAYAEVTDVLGHDVTLKTHVTLTDISDDANGFATARPYPQLTAYSVAPSALSVLETYDDWIDIVLTHEFVHVVHIDTVHGLARAINAVLGFGVLGKVIAPNLVQPRWIIEGLASARESDFSSMGRRRSAQFNAFLRMAVLDGTFQTLDQVSSGARIWPHGTAVYLYGLHFMHYISARFGDGAVRNLSHIYGAQIVPYGINRAIEKATGMTFYELWKDFKADVELRMRAEERRIRHRGLRQGRRLTWSGETTRYPTWSPDDTYIYFYKEDGHRPEGIKRLPATGGRMREGVGIGRQGADVDVEHVFDVEGPAEASFVGATQDMVFELTGVYDFRYRWSDLHRWNGGDPKRDEQLTFGARALEPHVSPDGREVVFRRNDTGQSRLGFVALDTGEIHEVAPLDRLAQVYTPRFSPDGRKVAFSGWRDGGYRDLYVFDRDTEQTERLTADRHLDLSPTWSPDGRYILFSSDRDGVFNIHVYDTTDGRVFQVSNVLGGAFEPALSHDGSRIAYIGYSGVGYDLWTMDFTPATWLVPAPTMSDLPSIENPKPPLPGDDGRPIVRKSHRYRAVATFFPRVIFPTALDFQSSQFGTALGFNTGLTDVLGYHNLNVAVTYDITNQQTSGAASYEFARLWPAFAFSASRGFAARDRGFTRYQYERDPTSGGSYLVTAYDEEVLRFSGSTRLPVVRTTRHSADVALAYNWTRWTNLDEDDLPIDPNAPASRLAPVGDAAEIELRASYSNESDGNSRFTFGVERGRTVGLNVGVFDEAIGSDFGDIQVGAVYREVVAMPWLGHQSALFEVRGGSSTIGSRTSSTFCVGDYFNGGDALRALVARQGYGTGCSGHIRGYPPQVRRGSAYATGSFEYRIPLLDVDRGLGTVPIFFRQIGMVPFFDVGNAWSDPDTARDVLMAAGASVVFGWRLGYLESINLLLQYAHGFDQELGLDSFRAVVSTSF